MNPDDIPPIVRSLIAPERHAQLNAIAREHIPDAGLTVGWDPRDRTVRFRTSVIYSDTTRVALEALDQAKDLEHHVDMIAARSANMLAAHVERLGLLAAQRHLNRLIGQ